MEELDRFILNGMGSHILDVTRFLFGEAETVYCFETMRLVFAAYESAQTGQVIEL